jgi:oligoendopeptidase F
MSTATTPAISDRAAIDPKLTWNLADLYASDSAWEADLKSAQSMIEKLRGFAGHLAESPKILWDSLELRSELSKTLFSLYQYAYLSKDLDNRVSKYQAMTDRAAMLGAQAGAASAFIEPELLKLDDAVLRKMASQFPKTDVYDFFIEELIRSKPHIRSEEVEELLAMSSMVSRGPDSIFSMMDDADIVYPSITDENGNEVQLTKQRYAKFVESSDRRVRRDAHEKFYEPYRARLNSLGATLASSVNKDIFYTKARHFDSCLANALDGNNIPLSVYHSLIEATESNLTGLHAYVRLRKRILKLDSIYGYDMLCPLFPDQDYEVDYPRAVERLLEAVAPLGNEYVSALRGAMNSRWVDVFETPGKGGGAYNYGNFSVHPFVLMNYNNTVDNMFTLAHEMGHAMHSYLSCRTQPFAKYHYSIFVAEVASTLNEGLLMQLLIKESTDVCQKLYLLNRYLDNTMGTFFNQVMYAHFELAIHEEVEKGGALSPDWMTEIWGEYLQKYFGPDLTVDECSKLKWARIPHFYNMFYVYQYATSYAASEMILDKFLKGEKDIVARYLEMLSSGGKDHPIELLKICGVDMTRPDAVASTLNRFAQQVAEVDRLIS